jgi:hypothetical protein
MTDALPPPPRPLLPRPLPPRQETFCRFVARGHRLSTAAGAAGYAPRSARQRGSELWGRPEIQRRVAELRAERERSRAAHIALSCQRLDMIFDSALRNGREAVALRTEAMRLMILDLVDADGPTDRPGRLDPEEPDDLDDEAGEADRAVAAPAPWTAAEDEADAAMPPTASPEEGADAASTAAETGPIGGALASLPPPPAPPVGAASGRGLADPDDPDGCGMPRSILRIFEMTPQEFIDCFERTDPTVPGYVRSMANIMAGAGFYPDLDLLATPEVAAGLREEDGPWHTMAPGARPPVPASWPRTIYTDRFKAAPPPRDDKT